MTSVIDLVLLFVVLAIHTLVAGVMTRFFRLRLETDAGWIVFTLFFVPIVLLLTTLVFSGPLGIGIDLGSPTVVVAVMVGLPLALGVAIDLLYVPAPDEVELPEPTETDR